MNRNAVAMLVMTTAALAGLVAPAVAQDTTRRAMRADPSTGHIAPPGHRRRLIVADLPGLSPRATRPRPSGAKTPAGGSSPRRG